MIAAIAIVAASDCYRLPKFLLLLLLLKYNCHCEEAMIATLTAPNKSHDVEQYCLQVV